LATTTSYALAIAYTDPIPMMMTLGNFEVVYEGATMSALSRVYVLLWNRGTSPIEADDFLYPITVTASVPILNLRIQDKDAAAAVVLDDNSRSLSINLLRPGEAITLVTEATSETYRPDIRIEMKSADMSTSIFGFHSLYPAIVALFSGVAILILEIWMLNTLAGAHPSPPNAPYGPFFKSDPGALIFVGTMMALLFAVIAGLLIAPVFFGAVTQFITKKLMSRSITPVAWRFSEFKLSAWTMRTRVKQFRKFMDAEYKKIPPN
jgi:hypothetical protein